MQSLPLIPFLILTAHLSAADVFFMTPMPTATTVGNPRSPQFGFFNPLVATQDDRSCNAQTLMSGLIVHHNGSTVTGLTLRCRIFGFVGGTHTNSVFDHPRIGYTSTRSSTIECGSGKAVTGVRVRSGYYLDAVSISCASTLPRFGSVVSFVDSVFGAGRGALVVPSTIGAASDPVGGAGGSASSFDCPASQPFVRTVTAAVSSNQLDSFQVACTRVLTRPDATSTTLPDLMPRTRGQQRRVGILTDLDTFGLDVFNLGVGVSNTGNSLFVDLKFSALDVQFTSVAPGCNFLSQGSIRCPIASIPSLGLVSFNFTYRALRARPEAPVIVMSTGYDIADFNFANNSYGFATTIQ